MKTSFHGNMQWVHKAPLNKNFIDTFLKKLGSIVFLFQLIEEQLKEQISLYAEMNLMNPRKENFGEIDNIMLAKRSFKDLLWIHSSLYYLNFPNADEEVDFKRIVNSIERAEEKRNKYVHSVYWFLPDKKVNKSKQGRNKKNISKVFQENVDFKEMSEFINDLFNIYYDLREIPKYYSKRK